MSSKRRRCVVHVSRKIRKKFIQNIFYDVFVVVVCGFSLECGEDWDFILCKLLLFISGAVDRVTEWFSAVLNRETL